MLKRLLHSVCKFIAAAAFISFLPLQINASGYLCLIGGGTEEYNSWSDTPYRWIVEKAGNGKVIILSYNESSEWLINYFELLGADTAENFTIYSRELANRNSTFDKITEAKAVFIKDAAQSKYREYWKGTRTEEALIELYKRGAVIAGKGGGAMILGDVMYTAFSGNISPLTAMNNPTSSIIDFERSFIGLLPESIIDTEFLEEGRIGRLIPFMLKYEDKYGININGIGIDGETALCVSGTTGSVLGSGAVTILRNDLATLLRLYPDSYEFRNIRADKIIEGWEYDFAGQKITNFSNSTVAHDFISQKPLPGGIMIFTGQNSFTYNFNKPFNRFRQLTHFTNAAFILNSGYRPQFATIENSLRTAGLNFSTVEVAPEQLNNPDYANAVENADALIFLSNNMSELALLARDTTALGAAIKTSIENGTPALFLGDASRLAAPVLCTNNNSDPDASRNGELKFAKGLGILPVVFQPGVFNNSDNYENNITSAEFAMMKGGMQFAAFYDESDYLIYNPSESNIKSSADYAWLVTDAGESTFTDTSKFIYNTGSNPRQVMAIDNLQYTASNDSVLFRVKGGKLVRVERHSKPVLPEGFNLSQNYPNPFNPSTTIEYKIPFSYSDVLKGGKSSKLISVDDKPVNVSLKVFDILGREVEVLVSEFQNPGNYSIKFNGGSHASGVYFYRLTYGQLNVTRKMLLMQ